MSAFSVIFTTMVVGCVGTKKSCSVFTTVSRYCVYVLQRKQAGKTEICVWKYFECKLDSFLCKLFFSFLKR